MSAKGSVTRCTSCAIAILLIYTPTIVQYVHLFIYYTARTEIYHIHTPMAMLHCYITLWDKNCTWATTKKAWWHWKNYGSALTGWWWNQAALTGWTQAVPVINLSCWSSFFTLKRPSKICIPKNAQREYAMVAGICNGQFKVFAEQFCATGSLRRWMQFPWRLTRIELRCRMVARFTKLPAATPWVTHSSILEQIMTLR